MGGGGLAHRRAEGEQGHRKRREGGVQRLQREMKSSKQRGWKGLGAHRGAAGQAPTPRMAVEGKVAHRGSGHYAGAATGTGSHTGPAGGWRHQQLLQGRRGSHRRMCLLLNYCDS